MKTPANLRLEALIEDLDGHTSRAAVLMACADAWEAEHERAERLAKLVVDDHGILWEELAINSAAWMDKYKAERDEARQIAGVLLRVARAGAGVLQQSVNNLPIAEAECMCFGNAICPFHNLRDALDALSPALRRLVEE